VKNLSALTGNIFSCHIFSSQLPEHDPEYETYECGSNQLFLALSLFGIMILSLLYFKLDIYNQFKNREKTIQFNLFEVIKDLLPNFYDKLNILDGNILHLIVYIF
jgi:hypothetical protein